MMVENVIIYIGEAETLDDDEAQITGESKTHSGKQHKSFVVHTCALLIRPYFAHGKFCGLYPVEQSVRTLIADKNLYRYYPIYACKDDCPKNDILLPLENELKKAGVVVRHEHRQAIIGVVKFRKCTDLYWKKNYNHFTLSDHRYRLVVHHSVPLPEPIRLRLGRGKVQGRWVALPPTIHDTIVSDLSSLLL